MECKYKFCHNDVPAVTSGHQPEYCKPAHKQAEYRRRNPDIDRKRLKRELTEARVRLSLLEQFAVKYAPAGYRKARDIAPIAIAEMIRLHDMAPGLVYAAIEAGVLKHVIDGEKLDASGQEAFYQVFHEGQFGWHNCEHCPHGVIP